MPNIPPSWLPHSKKGINKKAGVKRRVWNKIGRETQEK